MNSHKGADRLRPCPRKPNCVSSGASGRQGIEPIANGTQRWPKLAGVLERIPEIRVVAHEDDYIRGEARTRVLRFVDDIEFQYSPEEDVIHVRSASRLGYSDFGVNRRRLETIRKRLEEA